MVDVITWTSVKVVVKLDTVVVPGWVNVVVTTVVTGTREVTTPKAKRSISTTRTAYV
jgi:hypothetical protein